MPQTVADKTIFSLAEVARSIQKTIEDRYKSLYWIKAEMNKLNHYSHSGHCYPELLEKKDGKVVAEIRSTLWKGDYDRINKCFLEVTKEPLKNGINILLQASISYDPIHGLSLHIIDIDPAFSLGELEREKQESIERLKAQGIFDTNKQLSFPLLPKRIAIISVETSKGLADFLKIINTNPFGYLFEYQLFPALLQGEKSVASIMEQFKKISGHMALFDVVAIIRGGGGEVGLSSYNNFQLASSIATFPIPVITGIGHATNETVAEMVAYKNAITPSELADFLIQHFHNFANPVLNAEQILKVKISQLFLAQNEALANTVKYFKISSLNLLRENVHAANALSNRLLQQSKYRLMKEQHLFSQIKSKLSIQSKQGILQEQAGLGLLAQRLRREHIHLGKYFWQELFQLTQKLSAGVKIVYKKQQLTLEESQNNLSQANNQLVKAKWQILENQTKYLSLLDPQQVLKRGYSISLHNGKVLTTSVHVQNGDTIKTILAFGEIKSEVTFAKETNETDTL